MKRHIYYIMIAAAMLLTAGCNQGKMTDTNTGDTDSAGTAEVADGVDVAPDDQWTEEAVAQQIRTIYAEVSRAYAPKKDETENNTDLDAMFCTREFNDVQRQVRAINAKKTTNRRFEREDIRWTYGMDLPVTPQNIKVELLTGNIAEATFELRSGEQWMYTKLTLDWEDNQWKIRSWNEVGDDNSDLLQEMNEYVAEEG